MNSTGQAATSQFMKTTVSVVMPVRNEEDFIQESLEAVLAQDYPQNLVEIIVADGMSTDKTREIIRALQEKHKNIRLVDNPGKIAPSGLNIAISHTKGEIIIRVDGHCVIQPGYISRCVSYLINEEVDGVGGPMETIGQTGTAQVIAIAMSSTFGVGDSAFRTEKNRKMFVDTVAFPAYKMATIRRIGWYDEELVRNQDDEYNFRIRERGGRILMSPEIRSKYYSRSSFRSLWRQYYQYGYWKVRVMQKHPRQMSFRQFIPPLFVASLITLSVSSLFIPSARWLLSLVFIAYIFANLSASFTISIRNRLSFFPFLSLAYAILHISYGTGFLHGLMKFHNRWKVEDIDGR